MGRGLRRISKKCVEKNIKMRFYVLSKRRRRSVMASAERNGVGEALCFPRTRNENQKRAKVNFKQVGHL
jgi:hypothetical protein